MGVTEKIKQRAGLVGGVTNTGVPALPRCPARRVMIAGGGTGGHLFPGIAIAEAFVDRCPESRILFVSSGRPLEEGVLSKTRFEKAVIRVEGIKGKTRTAKLRAMVKLPGGLLASFLMLIRFRPHLVIGMGGYAAGPVIMCAWMLRIPRVIHEQNRMAGMTNRMLAKFVDRIYVSFEDTKLKAPAGKVRFTGNPVRKKILSALRGVSAAGLGSRKHNRKFTVLILGGSQGAHSLNTSAMDVLEYLKDPGKYRFVHQTGLQDAETAEAAYRKKGIEFMVEPFFEDMATLYQDADLVVCRAGATTVSEVSIAGCAVIFVPFPYAADNHQEHNAKGLVEAGAAELIPQKRLTGKYLADRIEFYAKHPETIEMRKKLIKKFSMPDAADRIVDDLCQLLGGEPPPAVCAA